MANGCSIALLLFVIHSRQLLTFSQSSVRAHMCGQLHTYYIGTNMLWLEILELPAIRFYFDTIQHTGCIAWIHRNSSVFTLKKKKLNLIESRIWENAQKQQTDSWLSILFDIFYNSMFNKTTILTAQMNKSSISLCNQTNSHILPISISIALLLSRIGSSGLCRK